MNLIRSVAPCALVLVALQSLSCGSKDEPPTSGGAYFQLQGGTNPEPPGGAMTCPDGGKAVTISVLGADGQAKLIVDGADGATVGCQADATHFSVTISNAAGTLNASGTLQVAGGVTTSKDTSALFHIPGATYKTKTLKCTVDVRELGSGKIYGVIGCPKIEHDQIANNACAVSNGPINGAFFRFANCKGF